MDIAGFVRSSVVSSTIWLHADWSSRNPESGDADNVRTGLRYIGALTILVSPVFEILQNSWLHLLTLLVLCVLLILLAIGLRLRPLLNTSTAFLLADLVGMVIRSANDHPGMLWMGGLVVGIAVIALAAICENQREKLLAQLRMLSSELATWN